MFNLGLFQKRFCSTSRVTGPAINMGSTKGRGSTTRMLNWCNEHSANPSLCINQFITMNTVKSNMQQYSIIINGITRYYTTINIDLANPDTSSLLLCFPGRTETDTNFISFTELNQIGSSVIVFLGQTCTDTVSFNNAFPWIYNNSNSYGIGQNDVLFADTVLDTIYGNNIPTNIFLTGKSDGAGFTVLYSQLSSYQSNIRAIGLSSSAHFGLDGSGNIGTYSLANSQQLFNGIIIPKNIIIPGNSVSVFIMHGTGDQVMPYNGQNYISSTAYNGSSNSIWATIDPSLNEVGGQIISNTYTTDFPSYISQIQTLNNLTNISPVYSNQDKYYWSYSTNTAGNIVLNSIKITDQNHDWSGHQNSGPGSTTTTGPNYYLDATYLFVLFFKLNLGNYKTKLPIIPANLKAYDGSPL